MLALALLNHILVSSGYSPISVSENQVYSLFSEGFVIVAALWAFWKNNSFSQNAIKADEYLEKMREELFHD